MAESFVLANGNGAAVHPNPSTSVSDIQPSTTENYSTMEPESVECPGIESHSDASEGSEPVIDIVINNVVSTFSTKCHINLKRVAMEGTNVIFRRENGMVSMKMRRPHVTSSIWSSGKITCTGATSEAQAKVAARKVARILQNMGFRVAFSNFRVVNVLGTCSMPFGIRISHFSRDHKHNASYEPELHPGVTYRIKDPKATLKVFSTGSITVTAPKVENVGMAIEHIYPLVSQYKMEKIVKNPQPEDALNLLPHQHHITSAKKTHKGSLNRDSDSEDISSDEEDENNLMRI